MKNREFGNIGEDLTCEYLKSIGMKIIERNYRLRTGEIDVIAMDGETVVFIEVKTRSNSNYGTPAESVTVNKQKKISQTARTYAVRKNLNDCDFRFDIVEVYYNKNNYRINLIKNAFEVYDGL